MNADIGINPALGQRGVRVVDSPRLRWAAHKDQASPLESAGLWRDRWSLDATSFGAYSVAEPEQWYQREKLAEPVMDTRGTKRLFFAGEGTARAIYNGSYPGAYESGLKAARDINATMLEEKARKDGRL